jgi:hypothetical protein
MTKMLEKELETYRKELPNLKDRSGKFVLIRGSEVLSVWSSYEDAIQEGYKVCKLDTPFLVKKIEAFEAAHFNSRMVVAACRH